jgi:hypothetical protein
MIKTGNNKQVSNLNNVEIQSYFGLRQSVEFYHINQMII